MARSETCSPHQCRNEPSTDLIMPPPEQVKRQQNDMDRAAHRAQHEWAEVVTTLRIRGGCPTRTFKIRVPRGAWASCQNALSNQSGPQR